MGCIYAIIHDTVILSTVDVFKFVSYLLLCCSSRKRPHGHSPSLTTLFMDDSHVLCHLLTFTTSYFYANHRAHVTFIRDRIDLRDDICRNSYNYDIPVSDTQGIIDYVC